MPMGDAFESSKMDVVNDIFASDGAMGALPLTEIAEQSDAYAENTLLDASKKIKDEAGVSRVDGNADTREYLKRLQRLALASLMINRMQSINEMLMLITTEAREIIGVHLAVTSMIRDASGTQSIFNSSFSEKYAKWRGYAASPDGSGLYTEVRHTNRPLRMTQEELEAHSEWHGFGHEAGKHPPLRGLLVVPLIGRDGQNIGLIQLSDKYIGEFNDEDEAILIQLAQMWLQSPLRTHGCIGKHKNQSMHVTSYSQWYRMISKIR